LDSTNTWQTIDSKITNDTSNWMKNAFIRYGEMKSSTDFRINKGSLNIILKNSGVIFNTNNPKVSKQFRGAQFLKIDTFVKVTENSAKYSDIQLCMNVPMTYKDSLSHELYLGFSFPIKDIYNAKFWIPALEWRSGYVYRDPISKLNSNGIYDDMSLNDETNIIGVSFYNSARLYIKKKSAASIICESKFESKE
jgi:hypothetical protein